MWPRVNEAGDSVFGRFQLEGLGGGFDVKGSDCPENEVWFGGENVVEVEVDVVGEVVISTLVIDFDVAAGFEREIGR